MALTTKEAQRAELHKTIWRVANDLRGSVDGWDFKSYVLGMLFYWTPMFSPVVEGVQGRYFIPPLLAALLAVGFWKRPLWKRSVGNLFAVGMPLLDFAVIICIYINIITK